LKPHHSFVNTLYKRTKLKYIIYSHTEEQSK